MRILNYLLFIFLATGLNLQAQNLFPNPDFELYDQCPTYTSQIEYCTDWDSAYGTADFYHCGFYMPSTIGSYGIPQTGNGVIGLICAPPTAFQSPIYFYGEFAMTTLKEVLIPHAKYHITANFLYNTVNYPYPFESCFDMGFYFFKSENFPEFVYNDCPPMKPHLKVSAGQIPTGSYGTFSWDWEADSCYDRVMIGFYCNDSTEGNFCKTKSSYFYFDIDNISMTKTIDAPSPFVSLTSNKTTFCAGECIDFNFSSNRNPYKYEWNFPGGNPSSSANANPTNVCYIAGGDYDVSVITQFECGSDTTSKSEYIHVQETPYLDLIADGLPECYGTSVEIKAISNATVTWDNGLVSDSRYVNRNGIYTATAKNNCGTISDTLVAEFEDCLCTVFLPNSFTPDGDGKNDGYKAYVNCNLQGYSLHIWNRWGQKIFSSNDQEKSWDGMYQGKKCPEGLYQAFLEYKGFVSEKLKTISKKSAVYLIR